MRNALRRKGFGLLWAGQTLSALGDPIFPFAMAFWAIDNDQGASGVAIIFAARGIAVAFTVVFGGVLADRLRRKNVMIAADLLRMLAILGIVATSGYLSTSMAAALVF